MSASAARPRRARTITRPAVRDSLADLLGFAIEFSRDAGFDEETAHAVRLAVEEACVNVIDHGYAGMPPGPIALTLSERAAGVHVEIADRARRFEPGEVSCPDLESAAEDRPLGGLGWFLIGELMDEVRHSPRAGGGNRLTMVRYLRRASDEEPETGNRGNQECRSR